MAIWVSRYSNKELRKGGYYPVGISIGKPRWPLGYELKEQCYSLAPKGYMLRMGLEDFRPAYFEKLEGIGGDKIIGIVERMRRTAESEDKELVLLCFEDVRVEGEWCHRTVFAQWWMEQTGEVIEELPDPSEPKSKRKQGAGTADKKEIAKPATEGPQQMSIFGISGGDMTYPAMV